MRAAILISSLIIADAIETINYSVSFGLSIVFLILFFAALDIAEIRKK